MQSKFVKPLSNRVLAIALTFTTSLSLGTFASENDESFSVHFAPGEVIQLIAPISDPEKQSLRSTYFKNNTSVAREYGYQSDGILIVNETLVGDFKPDVLVVSHWPSLVAQKTFQSLPLWNDAKTLRRQAWEELKLFDHQLSEPLTLEFKPEKSYTVAFAWTNPAHPSDYYDYMDALPPLLEKIGGRFMHKINDVTMSAHNPHALAPQQITFVEWDSPDGVEKLQSLPEFSEIYGKLRSGTTRFELHRISPRT